MTLRTLIIGAGTKGAMYPDERLTHAHAFSRKGFELVGFYDSDPKDSVLGVLCGGFELVGFYDSDPWQAQTSAKHWNTIAFENIKEAFEYGKPDIVTIAASDTAHYEILKEVAEHKPRLVFTEKPFCQSYEQAKEITELYEERGIPLQVNFTRRFLCPYQWITERNKGDFLAGCGFYTKGIHNASHLMDLLLMWGVPPEKVEFIEVDRSKLNVFEGILYFENFKIEWMRNGEWIAMTPIGERCDYPKDNIPDYSYTQTVGFTLSRAMDNAAANIMDHLENGTPLLCTASEALKTMKALKDKLGVQHD